MEYSQQSEATFRFKGQSQSISKEDVPGVPLNGRKPEHFKLYHSINKSQVLNISHCIPSQMNTAESDVKYVIALEMQKASLVDKWQFERWKCLKDIRLSQFGSFGGGDGVLVMVLYCLVSVLHPPNNKSWG